eukprot:TRINITY_DN1312_c0_g1_i1.p4 TRINITY_DN1312_c0_g1~~TRINITY_DN1312_c0_g1_i1.p4  ORF type:complete len:115 (-),score=16.38 TRINITY_DN1312_c0_g1_i1:506-850(-)
MLKLWRIGQMKDCNVVEILCVAINTRSETCTSGTWKDTLRLSPLFFPVGLCTPSETCTSGTWKDTVVFYSFYSFLSSFYYFSSSFSSFYFFSSFFYFCSSFFSCYRTLRFLGNS